jgi:hypothetical protein
MKMKIQLVMFSMLLLSSTFCFSAQVGAQDAYLVIDAPLDSIDVAKIKVKITDQNGNPVEDATVLFNEKSYTSNRFGVVFLFAPDVNQDTYYTINATKLGYHSSEVDILIEDFIHADQSLSIREHIDEAIKEGKVGGEVFVQRFETEVVLYANMTMEIAEVKLGRIALRVNGDENETGKTIVLNIYNETVDSSSEIIVEYDHLPVSMADDIFDILNPNDDGSLPEYVMLQGANGTQILVSIPHFSEHTITVYNLVEELGGITAAILYSSICVIVAIVFAGTIFIRKRV